MQKVIRNLFYMILPIMIIGMTVGAIPLEFTLIALLILLIGNNGHTIGVFLVMYGGILGGVIRFTYPGIPVYGILLIFTGIILIWDIIIDIFRKNLYSIIILIFVLSILGLFYIMGPCDDFSRNKYLTMWFHGFSALFGYYALTHSNKIDVNGLMQILIMTSICLFVFDISTYSFITEGPFDYNWFRTQIHLTEDALVDYQQVSMVVLYGFAIFLSQRKLDLTATIYYCFCTFELIMISGCRQAMFGWLLIIILRIFFFREHNIGNRRVLSQFIGLAAGLLVIYIVTDYFLTHSNIYMIQRVAEDGGDDSRAVLYEAAYNLFSENPLFGVGIGGFKSHTGALYPHNFILELLCECGLVGTLFIIATLITHIIKAKVTLLQVSTSDRYVFPLFFILFIRIMVSSDFKESIEIISFILAICIKSPLVNNKNKHIGYEI